jgi:hypothetical protein
MVLIRNIRSLWDKATLEAYIKKEYERIKHQALADAHSLAVRNADEDLIKSHSQAIHSSFEALHALIYQKLHAGARNVDIGKEEKRINERIFRNGKEIKKLLAQEEVHDMDIRRCDITYDWTWYKPKLAVVPIMGLTEIAYNSLAFTGFGGSLLSAIPGALGFAVATTLSAHYFPKFVRNIESKGKRNAAAVGVALCMLILFVFIGTLRSLFAHNNGDALDLTSFHFLFSSGAFSLINFFMWAALAFFSWYGLPSKEQWKEREKLNQLTDKLAEVQSRLAALNAENEILKAELDQLRKRNDAKTSIEELIESMQTEVVQLFENEVALKKLPIQNHSLN